MVVALYVVFVVFVITPVICWHALMLLVLLLRSEMFLELQVRCSFVNQRWDTVSG